MLSYDVTDLVDAKTTAAQVDTQINSKLAGILEPSQIVIRSNVSNQLKVINTSDLASASSDILLSRQSKDA